MSTLYTMVAPCFFGTESTLNFEVKRLGAQNIQVTDGRVAFQGVADVIAAANLNLRTAERVLLLLATYKATTFDELFDGCYNIAWEEPVSYTHLPGLQWRRQFCGRMSFCPQRTARSA